MQVWRTTEDKNPMEIIFIKYHGLPSFYKYNKMVLYIDFTLYY